MNRRGFTMVEMVVATGLLMIIMVAGSMVFISAQGIWSLTYTQIELQDNLRQGLQRLSGELQESGRDAAGVLQVTLSDNAGVNSTDILRFAVPLCVCGSNSITSAGAVRSWGAPLTWGATGCSGDYTLNGGGQVDICHAGTPNTDMSVSVTSVKAHLAHGDWLGACNACTPTSYNNRTIRYRVNSSSQLVREVLDSSGSVLATLVVASNVSNFQAGFITGQDALRVTLTVVKTSLGNRTNTASGTSDVILRNGG